MSDLGYRSRTRRTSNPKQVLLPLVTSFDGPGDFYCPSLNGTSGESSKKQPHAQRDCTSARSPDWSVLHAYAPSSRPIGSRCTHMPPPLARLVRAARICPLLSPDWSALRAYAPSSRPIGSRCAHMLPPLARLVRAARICPLLSPD
eukprot:1184425-Prorocentrum_minimum.AAC.1